MPNFIEIKESAHFNILSELGSTLSAAQLEADSRRGFFTGFFYLKNLSGNIKDTQAYIIVTKGYSTWEHRMYFIRKLWLSPDVTNNERELILTAIRDFLFARVQEFDVARIQINFEFNAENEYLKTWLESDKVFNLTAAEGWHMFGMNEHDMLKLIEAKPAFNKTEFQIVKVINNNMHLYADGVCDLIRELAVYESMLDQCHTSTDKLVRDNDTSNKFYDCLIVVDTATQKLIGYALYFLAYDMERGRGCYLEDLYVSEKYRNKGLGKALWQAMTRDAIETYEVRFMEWSVLNWNKSSIDFYNRFNGVDLTLSTMLNSIRYTKNRIYPL